MKYLLVFAVLGIAIWIWRSRHRQSMQERQPAQRRRIAGPQEMVACVQCGLHLPLADAVSDSAQHAFCSVAHREQYLAATRKK